MPTITARYPGRCSATGAEIRPGDRVEFDPTTRATVLVQRPPDVDDAVDRYMPRFGLGRSRAQVWRAAQNARHGAGLDHESE